MRNYSLTLVATLALFFAMPLFADDNAPANPNEIMDDGEVLAVPKVEAKVLTGYQLQELADQSVMKQLGLKKGDVLVEGKDNQLIFTRKGKKMKIESVDNSFAPIKIEEISN